MLSAILPESFYIWFRKFSAPLPEDINRYLDPQKSFIDIGAGNGFFLATVTATKKRAAVEVWDKQIAYLKQHFPDITVYTGIEQVQQQYDVAVCIDVLHHIEDNAQRDRFLEKLYTIIKPGGTLIIKDMRDDLLIHKYFARLTDYVSTKSHTNEMNPEQLIARLQAAGFRIDQFKKYTALLYGHYYIAASKH